ncbi:MAG TPA: serine/threonine-protein kinase, partial [Planctomycetota bacterium]|nr:serine/threonine-protein kinase [Planctomycetota bacterium]
ERLAEEFAARLRRGERPEIEEYIFAHPSLASEIRAVFSTLVIIEELGRDWTETASESVLPDGENCDAACFKQIGDFRILREVGRGGMGVVYEAEQVSLGRRVALKVLPFHSLFDTKRLERFQQEARAAARLTHPSIVPVYGVGEHLGVHYYVMQLVPGQGLHRVIEEVRRLRARGEPEVDIADPSTSSSLASNCGSGGSRSARERYFRNMARLVRDAAHALDYAHGEGILHRDVKPSNLLLDPNGRVWLTDFGLAKAEGTDELTKSGDFVGTIPYMAPECFKGWSDPRSDVYGLGVSLYELLTLRPAFAERDRALLIRRVTTEEPPALRRIDRAIPRDLETVVLKAIAKEPAHRYASARAMADDLDRFLSGLPVEARRSGVAARVARWCGRNPLSATLAALVVLLLVVV